MVAEVRLREAAARYRKIISKLCTDQVIVGIRALLAGDSDESASGHFVLMCEVEGSSQPHLTRP